MDASYRAQPRSVLNDDFFNWTNDYRTMFDVIKYHGTTATTIPVRREMNGLLSHFLHINRSWLRGDQEKVSSAKL